MKQTDASMKVPERQAVAAANRLLNVDEVAEQLGVSTRQVWKLLSSGRLPRPVRLSRSVRWRSSDIERFIECGCDMEQFQPQRERVFHAR